MQNISLFLLKAAKCRIVHLLVDSMALMSAPASSSNRAILKSPNCAAECKGYLPTWLGVFTRVFFFLSKAATSSSSPISVAWARSLTLSFLFILNEFLREIILYDLSFVLLFFVSMYKLAVSIIFGLFCSDQIFFFSVSCSSYDLDKIKSRIRIRVID